jgi:predicted enzyme related to lactoylglutathione lyase
MCRRSATFYRDALGMAVTGDSPAFVQFRMSNGTTFALQQHAGPRPAETVELWWQADDADALHAALSQRGVQIVAAPADMPFGRTLAIRDPEGNVVNFYAPRQG